MEIEKDAEIASFWFHPEEHFLKYPAFRFYAVLLLQRSLISPLFNASFTHASAYENTSGKYSFTGDSRYRIFSAVTALWCQV